MDTFLISSFILNEPGGNAVGRSHEEEPRGQPHDEDMGWGTSLHWTTV